MATNDEKLSTLALHQLRSEAAAAGDWKQVDLCTKAIDGDEAAMAECVKAVQR